MVLGQYNLVLLGIKWYWVIIWLLCQYILKTVEIWSDVTIAGRTDKRTNKQGKIELLSQWTMDGWDEQYHGILKKKDPQVNYLMFSLPYLVTSMQLLGSDLSSSIVFKRIFTSIVTSSLPHKDFRCFSLSISIVSGFIHAFHSSNLIFIAVTNSKA